MQRTNRYLIIILILLIAVAFPACNKSNKNDADKKKEAITAMTPPEDKPGIWAFTGLPAEDADSVLKRPLSVKIEDSDVARPQKNISRADIIYETMVEGGETRFNCIYQSDIPDEVGNIRSARLSDAWVVPQYSAILFYSGSNREVDRRLKSAGVPILSHGRVEKIYYRSTDKVIPHNLYLKLPQAYDAAKSKKYETELKEIKPLAFGEISEDQQTLYKPVKGVTIPFANYSSVTWTWSEADGAWLREQGGEVHKDSVTDKQISCDTIAVMTAVYTTAKSVDTAGSPTYDCNLGGEGKAMIFRDGKMIECTWIADKDTPPKFVDASGEAVYLKPGHTWFEVPPTYTPTKVF